MMRPLHTFALTLAIAFVALTLGGCSPAASGPAYSEEKKESFAQAFMVELRDEILPLKEKNDKLTELGIVVSDSEGAKGLDYLYSFYQLYQNGEEASITMLFSSQSIVVTRICFDGEFAYYYRYEDDEKNPIAVTGRAVDTVKLTYDDNLQKTELLLQYHNKDIANFSFKDVSK